MNAHIKFDLIRKTLVVLCFWPNPTSSHDGLVAIVSLDFMSNLIVYERGLIAWDRTHSP